jgi:transposase
MMGQQGGSQDRLFYSFNLDDHVPRGHLLRGIDQVLDLRELRAQLAPFYSHTGRPSVDPELILRMLIVGYCSGIRSERRLCEEVHLNMAYRWLCRLELDEPVPNHSTFSKNRHGRFRASEAFRQLFESVLRRCMTEGLVGGEGFATDASFIRADANRTRGVAGDQVPKWEEPSRAVREYLDGLEKSNPVASDDDELPPGRNVSLTDPSAHWTAAPGGPPQYAYSTNYLIDLEAGIIVDVEATPANRTQEVESTKAMVNRVERALRHKASPSRRRHGVRDWRNAVMDGQGEENCASRSGLGQDGAQRWNAAQAASSAGTGRPTSTTVHKASLCAASDATSPSLATTSPKLTRSSIVQASRTARDASLSRVAAPTHRSARLLGAFTRSQETWDARLHRRRNTWTRSASARKSRCCSPT